MQQTRTFECTPDVVFENFGDETILLHLKSGNYYSLNGTAMVAWELLSQQVEVDKAAARLAAIWPDKQAVTLGDLERLAGELVRYDILRPAAEEKAADSVVLQTAIPPAYEAPQVTQFDDIADLLLLDPVHDVSDAGWPHTAPPASN